MYASRVHCVSPASYVMTSPHSVHPILMQVWVTMFARLLKDPLIPAIVVPEGYPNESTWRLLRQSVPTEVTGSILTCQHDISAEWRTYYDYRWVTMATELIQNLNHELSALWRYNAMQPLRTYVRTSKDLPT